MNGGSSSLFRMASPACWFLVFSEHTAVRWWRWMPGRFKHVTAVAALPDVGGWLVIDPGYDRTDVALIADEGFEALVAEIAGRGAVEIVRMPVLKGPSRVPRWGFWCTALAGHLVGLSPCALRPDGLLRQCLANGGELIHGAVERTEAGDEAPEDGRTAHDAAAGQDDAAGPAAADA